MRLIGEEHITKSERAMAHHHANHSLVVEVVEDVAKLSRDPISMSRTSRPAPQDDTHTLPFLPNDILPRHLGIIKVDKSRSGSRTTAHLHLRQLYAFADGDDHERHAGRVAWFA